MIGRAHGLARCARWSAVGLLTPLTLAAQTLVAARAPTPVAVPGQEIAFEIDLQRESGTPWCGLRVDFGNGQSREFRIGDNGASDLALKFAQRFPSPGVYTVRVSGKTLVRGLRTAAACGGGEKLVQVQVDVSPQVVAGVTAGGAEAPLATAGTAPGRLDPVTAPPPSSPSAAQGSSSEIEQLRAELARLQAELREHRDQTAGGARNSPAVRSGSTSLPSGSFTAPVEIPQQPGVTSGSSQTTSGVPSVYPNSSYPMSAGAVGTSSSAYGQGSPSVSGSSSSGSGSGSGGYGDVSGSASGSAPDSGCGPNPSAECASRLLVESIAKLRELARSRRGASGSSGSPGGAATYSGGSGSPPPGSPAGEVTPATVGAYPSTSGSYAGTAPRTQAGASVSRSEPSSSSGSSTNSSSATMAPAGQQKLAGTAWKVEFPDSKTLKGVTGAIMIFCDDGKWDFVPQSGGIGPKGRYESSSTSLMTIAGDGVITRYRLSWDGDKPLLEGGGPRMKLHRSGAASCQKP